MCLTAKWQQRVAGRPDRATAHATTIFTESRTGRLCYKKNECFQSALQKRWTCHKIAADLMRTLRTRLDEACRRSLRKPRHSRLISA